MASSQPERQVHQDYIARVRYSNALPPPPNPPKLLDIPNTGLASGQYTAPGFASRLAREQPLNIEADAELGMPLDLVGMPGIFDGDESSIQAPLQSPPVHPHDKALLRALSTLGKPKFSDAGVSFLRRTEYISSSHSKSRFESTTSRSLIDSTGTRTKKTPTNVDKESPEHIKSEAERSFVVAAQNLKNAKAMRHPTKKNLKCVEAYPLLPDQHAYTDVGGYATLKFLTNPVPPSSTYDARLESSILLPIASTPEEDDAYQQAADLYARDPESYKPPIKTINYQYFLTNTVSEAMKMKRKFDPLDEETASEDLYASKRADGTKSFALKRLRGYESATLGGEPAQGYDDEVIITVSDGTDGVRARGAYYYPVCQKISIRPRRSKNINNKFHLTYRGTQQDADDEGAEILQLRISEPDEMVTKSRNYFVAHPYGHGVDGDEEDEEAEVEVDDDVQSDHGAEALRTPVSENGEE